MGLLPTLVIIHKNGMFQQKTSAILRDTLKVTTSPSFLVDLVPNESSHESTMKNIPGMAAISRA